MRFTRSLLEAAIAASVITALFIGVNSNKPALFAQTTQSAAGWHILDNVDAQSGGTFRYVPHANATTTVRHLESYGGNRAHFINNVPQYKGTAEWTFTNVQPGTYRVIATWPHMTYLDETHYEIYDGNYNLLTGYAVDQSKAPNQLQMNDVGWVELGEYEVSSSILHIKITNSGSYPSWVAADAVAIKQVGAHSSPGSSAGSSATSEPIEYVLDDTEAQRTPEQVWHNWHNPNCYQNTCAYTQRPKHSGEGVAEAHWEFSQAQPGIWHIFGRWPTNPVFGSEVVVEAANSNGLLKRTFTMNQREATTDSGAWRRLGHIQTFSSGVTITMRSTDTNGFYLVIDAFKITYEPFGGSSVGSSVSSASSTGPVCGNGVKEGNEECDDGNDNDNDACSNSCTLNPVCGNGVVEEGEACDDANDIENDYCGNSCQADEAHLIRKRFLSGNSQTLYDSLLPLTYLSRYPVDVNLEDYDTSFFGALHMYDMNGDDVISFDEASSILGAIANADASILHPFDEIILSAWDGKFTTISDRFSPQYFRFNFDHEKLISEFGDIFVDFHEGTGEGIDMDKNGTFDIYDVFESVRSLIFMYDSILEASQFGHEACVEDFESKKEFMACEDWMELNLSCSQ